MNFLYFFLFYQSTVQSSHTVDGHQMYFGGSVVGIKLQQLVERSHQPSPNCYRGVKKCESWRRLIHHSTLSRPRLKMLQDFWILKQKCNAAMIALCL